jgi:hypothetical protein
MLQPLNSRKMKTFINTILPIILIFGFSMGMWAQIDGDLKKEQEAIKNIIQTAYVEGLQNEGDFEKIDKGFHPSFNLLGIDNGDIIRVLPIYSWKERIKQDKAAGKFPKPEANKVTIKFLSVDVTGTAAVAKFEFYVGGKLTFIDYLSLLKFESGWKIVSKVFYKIPEGAR